MTLSALVETRRLGAPAAPVWRADGGRFVADGEVAVWEAPWVGGTYTIRASHVHGGPLEAAATISVPSRTSAVGPLEGAPDLSGAVVPFDLSGFGPALWTGEALVTLDAFGAPSQVFRSVARPDAATLPERWFVAVAHPEGGVVLLSGEGAGGRGTLAEGLWAGAEPVEVLALHPSGRTVAYASNDQVYVRELSEGHLIATWAAPGPVHDLDWRPVGGGCCRSPPRRTPGSGGRAPMRRPPRRAAPAGSR